MSFDNCYPNFCAVTGSIGKLRVFTFLTAKICNYNIEGAVETVVYLSILRIFTYDYYYKIYQFYNTMYFIVVYKLLDVLLEYFSVPLSIISASFLASCSYLINGSQYVTYITSYFLTYLVVLHINYSLLQRNHHIHYTVANIFIHLNCVTSYCKLYVYVHI